LDKEFEPFMSQMALKASEEAIYLDSRGFYAGLKSSSLTTNGSDFVNKNSYNDSFHQNEDRMKSLSELPEWFEVIIVTFINLIYRLE
jgi:hypothetical protein